MSTLYTCPDVQNKGIKLIYLILGNYFGQNVLEIQTKLEI